MRFKVDELRIDKDGKVMTGGAEERHAHQDYVSALEYAISALEDRSKLIDKSKEQ